MSPLIRFGAALLSLALLAPLPARALEVLDDPDFLLATRTFTPAERLELAAHLNMVLRQPEKAIPMYEALAKRSPNRAELWFALASAYNHADEPREAHDAANIAITLAPHYPHFYGERGIAALLLGRPEAAVEDLARFVKAFPHAARAHYYLGLAQAAAGDAAGGRESLLRARRLNPALSLLADYYLGLIAAGNRQLGTARHLLGETRKAFEGIELPIARTVAQQVGGLDGVIGSRLREAIHRSDATVAAIPEPVGR